MAEGMAFSICEGGRFHDTLRKAGLTGGPRGRLGFVLLLIAIGLLPLVILSGMAGTAFGGAGRPLFHDLAPWIRYLVVLPILVLAEPFTDRFVGLVVDTFRRAGIVREPDVPVFETAVERATRTATSDTVELILLVAALSLPHLAAASLPRTAIGAGWHGTIAEGVVAFSAAGRWYAWVSLPLVEFLLLRWFWRVFAWGRLLWRLSRLDLALAPAHPDRAAGLGFLALSARAFLPLCIGLSMLAATGLSKLIQSREASLMGMRGPVIALIVVECLLLLAPQCFFAGALLKAKNRALIGYGLAATAMTREFGRHWTDQGPPKGVELLGSAEPSAMIDYASTYGLVQGIQPIPGLSLRQVLGIVLLLATPFAPLLLYEYSVKEILQQLLQLVR